MKIRTALISAFHKEGIAEFVRNLIALGVEIIYGSKGTIACLKEAGVQNAQLIDVATIVGEPILGHRVVTLSRQVHAALLAQYVEADLSELKKLGLPPIDLVCVDMYPLKPTTNDPTKTLVDVLEKMDIGGPTMLSSGSKGQRVVIGDFNDRQKVIDWMKAGQPDEAAFIKELAAKADFMVSEYRMLSAKYRSQSKFFGIFGERVATCSYGENAWQAPAHLYSAGTEDPLALDKFVVIEGKPPSYNNWVDIDRLLQTTSHIAGTYAINEGVGTAIAVGVKHGNPCGAAAGPDRSEVVKKMMAGDSLAIFGGLVMMNFEVDEALCETLVGKMLDGIIAPAFTPDAIAMLRRKGDKCRFVVNPALRGLSDSLDITPRFRYVRGGFLAQPNYTFIPDFNHGEIVKHGTATPMQECDMAMAWAIGSTSNSNTITLVKDEQLIGNGVGQQDRVGAAQLAITRARRSGHNVANAVAYSDSFFPFPDGPQTLIDAGVTAIFTSSGSMKDQATIDACAKHGVILYMIPDKIGRGFYGH